jgi:hypothetical protein
MLLLKAVLDGVHRAADLFAMVVGLAEVHRQQHLGVLGSHADQRRHPHPEQRTGATDGDGRGHAGDVAGAHRRRQRRHQCRVGTDVAPSAGFGVAALPDHAETGADAQHRHQLQAQLQEQAGAEDQHQHRRSPDEVVDRRDDGSEGFQGLVS